MSLVLSAEQRQLQDSVRGLLSRKSPAIQARTPIPYECDPDAIVDDRLFAEMARLGLFGLAVPEGYGGQGFAAMDALVAFEETGRALLGGAFLPTVGMAIPAILITGTEDQKSRFLPDLAMGRRTATLGIEGDITATPTSADATCTLAGELSAVPCGNIAGTIVVATGGALYLVDDGAPNVRRASVPSLDLTRPIASISFDGTPAIRLGSPADEPDAIALVQDVATIYLCAEMLGTAAQCLAEAVEYALVRHQFGRQIASFQSIKHKCADVLVDVEVARTLVYSAASTIEASAGDVRVAASLAKIACSNALLRAASENIQIHGGIGFTWEQGAHLYLRRAVAASQMFGTPEYHRERLADHVVTSLPRASVSRA